MSLNPKPKLMNLIEKKKLNLILSGIRMHLMIMNLKCLV